MGGSEVQQALSKNRAIDLLLAVLIDWKLTFLTFVIILLLADEFVIKDVRIIQDLLWVTCIDCQRL